MSKISKLNLMMLMKKIHKWVVFKAEKRSYQDISFPRFRVSRYYKWVCGMNRPVNSFASVVLGHLSLTRFGLFIPCFPLHKASSSLAHTRAHTECAQTHTHSSCLCLKFQASSTPPPRPHHPMTAVLHPTLRNLPSFSMIPSDGNMLDIVDAA